MVMKDGQLFEKDGRYELRFVRELSHPLEKVWEAVTSPEGLSAWFPFDVVGERRRARPCGSSSARARARRSRARWSSSRRGRRWSSSGTSDETLRLELEASGPGCVLTLINRFDEVGKAARDAAGWHACLDALEASLAGASIDTGAVWGEVHPDYVSRFGPEAATIGPPS